MPTCASLSPRITPTFHIPAYQILQQQSQSDYKILCNTAHVQPMQAAHFVMSDAATLWCTQRKEGCAHHTWLHESASFIHGLCFQTAGLTRTERSQSHAPWAAVVYCCHTQVRTNRPYLQIKTNVQLVHTQNRHYTHNMSMLPALQPCSSYCCGMHR
jgi:hypothetical protein